MFSCYRRSCRRLVARSLWFACCMACLSCFIVVFLSVQCLEDHRESRHGDTDQLKTASYGTHDIGRGTRFELSAVLDENRKLKRLVRQLTQRLSRGRGGKASDTDTDLLSGIPRSPSLDNYAVPRDGIDSWWQKKSSKYESIRNSLSRDIVLKCKDMARIRILKEIGRGYTKVTQLGLYNGLAVAVKSVGLDSTDVQQCVQGGRAKVPEDCLVFSRYKIMKELLLYQQLHHPNIVKLLGYCLQSDKDTNDIKSRGLTVVTELGSPVDLMALLQMPWHQRFRVAVGLARLVHFFSVSPLGSLVMRDFQVTQFVLVDGEIKLSDMDDVGNEPRPCNTSNDCFLGNEKYNATLECSGNQCRGYNEKWNIYNFYRFYLTSFLLPGVPASLRVDLERITDGAALLNTDSKMLVEDLERALTKLRTGDGLNSIAIKNDVKYNVIPGADFPGRHDYPCSDQSLSSVNCQFLVFDEAEAKQRCNEDDQCMAFVMSYKKIWTGYRSVYLKNGTSGLIFSQHNMVYIKVK